MLRYRYTCIYLQWALIYPTTFVPSKMCWINEMSDNKYRHTVTFIMEERQKDSAI